MSLAPKTPMVNIMDEDDEDSEAREPPRVVIRGTPTRHVLAETSTPGTTRLDELSEAVQCKDKRIGYTPHGILLAFATVGDARANFALLPREQLARIAKAAIHFRYVSDQEYLVFMDQHYVVCVMGGGDICRSLIASRVCGTMDTPIMTINGKHITSSVKSAAKRALLDVAERVVATRLTNGTAQVALAIRNKETELRAAEEAENLAHRERIQKIRREFEPQQEALFQRYALRVCRDGQAAIAAEDVPPVPKRRKAPATKPRKRAKSRGSVESDTSSSE